MPINLTDFRLRYQKFRRLVNDALKQQYGSTSIPIEDLTTFVAARSQQDPFSPDEIQTLLAKMDADQTIMITDGTVHVL